VVLNYGKKQTVSAMLLHEILDIAISITGADKGNIQLFTPETRALTIAAQRGFDSTFLNYFKAVHKETPGAAAAAMRSVEPVIVEDVTTDQIFVGDPSMNVVIDAGARAILCVPIVRLTGNLLGVISTHFRHPHRPTKRELGLVGTLARAASASLDGIGSRAKYLIMQRIK
jgi:GAF domain-containing protein